MQLWMAMQIGKHLMAFHNNTDQKGPMQATLEIKGDGLPMGRLLLNGQNREINVKPDGGRIQGT